MKPTKEQFEAYVKVQRSGVTNMLAVDLVCALADGDLRPEHCFYIYGHYKELSEEYGVKL